MATTGEQACTISAAEPIGTTSTEALACNSHTLDRIVNSSGSTFVVNRVGNMIDTLVGRLLRLGYEVPITYAAGIVFNTNDNVKTVQQGDFIYAPKPASLPFTTTNWPDDRDKFFTVQGFTRETLALELTQPYIFTTVAAYKAHTTEFPIGKTVHLVDRRANFEVISGISQANESSIIASSQVSQSLRIRNEGVPVLEQYGVSPTATAAFNSLAIQQAITDGEGSFSSAIVGNVPFNSQIVVRGSGGSINLTGDLQFTWTGSQNATAWKFGNGTAPGEGVRSMEIYNFKINDAVGGVDTLLHLHDCIQCQFYSLTMTANGAPTRGLGLKTEFAFINDFFGAIITGFWNSWELDDDTNSTTFYGLNIEGGQNDGILIPAGAETNRNMLVGGTIEGVVNNGVHVTQPPSGLTFKGTYFEANGTSLRLDMAATQTVPITLQDCRFTADTATAAITITGLGRVVSENSTYSRVELFNVTNAAAWVTSYNSINEGATFPEFVSSSVGRLISKSDVADAVRFNKIRTLELAGYKVPVMQTGNVSSLAAGASQVVVFPTAFKNIPFVVPNLGEHTAVSSIVTSGVTAAEVTFRNRGAATVSFSWAALDIGDLD